MSEQSNKPFLGRGWSYPPGFDTKQKKVAMVKEEQDIQQSIAILLSTRQGERVMQPNYGCNLDIMLFEPLTTTLITRVRDLIRTSILLQEPRIDLIDIEINTQNVNSGVIQIELFYAVRSTNSRFNYVYPFYLEEASNIKK